MAERKTGSSIPAGILRPTAPLDDAAPDPIAVDAGQGGQGQPDEPTAEVKTPRRVRSRKASAAAEVKLEGRRIYLSEDVHFRLRMLAYQRGRNLSEIAEEVLDKALPKWSVNRVS